MSFNVKPKGQDLRGLPILRSCFGLFAMFFVLILVVCACTPFVSFGLERMVIEEITVTIDEKYVKRQDDADVYMVAVTYEDGRTEVLENRDSLSWAKYNSHDVQHNLKVGGKYKLLVTGWRVPFFSMTRNIAIADELEPPRD